MFDVPTDVSVCKNKNVMARFIDYGIPKGLYIKIQEVKHAGAAGVLEAFKLEFQVPW